MLSIGGSLLRLPPLWLENLLRPRKESGAPRSHSADLSLRLRATPKPKPHLDPEACTSFNTPHLSGFVEPYAWKPFWQHVLGHTRPQQNFAEHRDTPTVRSVSGPWLGLFHTKAVDARSCPGRLPSMSSDYYVHRVTDWSWL